MTQNGDAVGFMRKTSDRKGFVSETIEKYSDRIESAERIFVKPNIVSHEPYPTTTHPEVLDTVLEELDGKDVVVGDGLAIDIMRTHRTLLDHELHDVCERRGVKILDLHQTPSSTYKSERGFSVALSRTPFNFDLIISLPVLKSHKICKMTGALKNQFGFATKAERLRLHSGLKDIDKAIAEINVLRGPGIVIMDAVETMTVTNEIRHGGKPAQLGYMLAGTDPVALDVAGLALLAPIDSNLWAKKPKDIAYIAHAAEYGVGNLEGVVEEI